MLAPPSPRPIKLTDNQLSDLMRLSEPLHPRCRDAFLRILAHELRGQHDIGDGLHRLALNVIRANRLFDPPELGEEERAGA